MKKILIILGVGVTGYLVYRYFTRQRFDYGSLETQAIKQPSEDWLPIQKKGKALYCPPSYVPSSLDSCSRLWVQQKDGSWKDNMKGIRCQEVPENERCLRKY